MRDWRVSPPPVAIDADLAWLLRLAFGNDMGTLGPADPERSLELARRSELSGRIAERLTRSRPPFELGQARTKFEEDFFTNLAIESLLARALETVTIVAERRGTSLVALKYAALRLTDVMRPGTRVVGDLDLLIAPEQAEAFWHALVDVGFARTRTRRYDHQLESLVDPYGAIVELHVQVPGVCAMGRYSPSLDDLRAAGVVRLLSGPLLVLEPAVLAAHAIAHALSQNRATPQTYSPLRMLADIVDLRSHDRAILASAAGYLGADLGASCAVIDQLCCALSAEALSGVAFDGSPAQSLLWHCIAARQNRDYTERLRASALGEAMNAGPAAFRRFIGGALFPAEHELEVISGMNAEFDRVRGRWQRPFALLSRVARRWSRLRQR